MKRILSLLLCLVMGLTLLPAVPAFAAGDVATNDMSGVDGTLHWHLDSTGTLTLRDATGAVTKCGACPKDQVIRVIFDAGTTKIGGSVLSGCKKLIEVSIPNGVTSLGGWLFEGCSSLKTVEIPASVTNIDRDCFARATGLKDILVDSANTRYKDVGGVLFSKDGKTLWAVPCGKGTTYTVPDGVTKIEAAFRNNKKLTSVTMPDTVRSIEGSFNGCSALTAVSLSKNLKTVGGYAFAYCTSLENVTLPDSVTKIDDSAFAGNTALTDIALPDSVKTLGAYAFMDSALRSVTIPAGVTSMDRGVFDGCKNLREIILWCDSSALARDTLWGITSTVLYPADNASWTPEVLSQMKENFPEITWIPFRILNISKQPSSVTTAAGNTVSFTVEAEGAESYQWYYRKSSSDPWAKCSGAGATTATLPVEAKSYRNGYQYRCLLKNVLGSLYTKTVTLSVKPGITTQPADKTAASGAAVSFTVKASGAESYQWYYRKSETGAWNKCSDGASATLSVEAKAYRDGYQYRCKVTNAVGSTYSEPATLRVGEKPVITAQPTGLTAGIGKPAVFSVAAEGAVSYQWYYNKNFYVNPDSWIKCSEGTGAVLTVTAKSYRDGYSYRCRISNEFGTVYSDMVMLHVPAKPEFEGAPETTGYYPGEKVEYYAHACGENVSYQWYFRKSESDSWHKCTEEGATTDTLVLVAKAYRNGYQYRCRASNISGTVYSGIGTLYIIYSE